MRNFGLQSIRWQLGLGVVIVAAGMLAAAPSEAAVQGRAVPTERRGVRARIGQAAGKALYNMPSLVLQRRAGKALGENRRTKAKVLTAASYAARGVEFAATAAPFWAVGALTGLPLFADPTVLLTDIASTEALRAGIGLGAAGGLSGALHYRNTREMRGQEQIKAYAKRHGLPEAVVIGVQQIVNADASLATRQDKQNEAKRLYDSLKQKSAQTGLSIEQVFAQSARAAQSKH